jgi:hypothetical protein
MDFFSDSVKHPTPGLECIWDEADLSGERAHNFSLFFKGICNPEKLDLLLYS